MKCLQEKEEEKEMSEICMLRVWFNILTITWHSHESKKKFPSKRSLDGHHLFLWICQQLLITFFLSLFSKKKSFLFIYFFLFILNERKWNRKLFFDYDFEFQWGEIFIIWSDDALMSQWARDYENFYKFVIKLFDNAWN